MQLRKALSAQPGFSSAHVGLWGAFYRKGMYAQAADEAQKFFAALDDREVEDCIARSFASGGYAPAMREAAGILVRRSRYSQVPCVRIARLYAHGGDGDQTIWWLEEAYRHREMPLMHLSVAWDWDVVRQNPRFRDLLRRLGLPE